MSFQSLHNVEISIVCHLTKVSTVQLLGPCSLLTLSQDDIFCNDSSTLLFFFIYIEDWTRLVT